MARKEKGLVSRIVSFSVGWIIGILISILISIWKSFSEKIWGRGNEGWCGSTYKYTYNLTYKYLEFFPKGKGACGRGNVEGGRRGGFGFPSVFRGLSPRSLTRKPTYNKTCNPTYNPSYCPHTSDVARGGTAIGAFGTAELRSRKHGGEGKGAQRGESR